ncbi:MAG: hypothetical protein E6K53_07880 [Gammaproteobacteria bacterium]|nr:MAG: hypothetical protein E6K53_07880 [Gammaproteobacteria bacterium]
MSHMLRSNLISRFLWCSIALMGADCLVGKAWAQNELFVSNQNAGSITVYGRTASGDTAPTRTLSTSGLGISGGMFVDTVNSELVELNKNTNTVYVFGETASGNTAATRTLVGASTGIMTPTSVVVDTVNNELLVANNGNNSVTVYARTASGNTAPTRTLSGASTGLSSLAGIAVDTVNNELFSANNNLSITVYGRTASGNTAPTRTLNVAASTGPSHALGGVFVDTVNNELFVSAFDSPLSANASILVYSRTASGNTAPIRTLIGASTGLGFPLGVIVDTVNNELLVANQGVPSITAYPRTASGNTAPTRTLIGPSTGLSEPAYLAVTTGAAPPPSASTTTLTSSVNPSASGQAVIFSASVSGSAGTPTGTVTFLDGATTIGSGTLNASGMATLTTSALAVGTHSITAQYAGSGTYAGSTSNLVNQTVNAVVLPSSTQLTVSPTTAAPGQAITFTASVSGSAGTPGGTVTFLDGATTIGTGTLDAVGVATLTTSALAVGTHPITAQYAGSGTYTSSTSSSVVVTIAVATVVPAAPAPAMSPAVQWALALCCLLAGAYAARRRRLSMSR